MKNVIRLICLLLCLAALLCACQTETGSNGSTTPTTTGPTTPALPTIADSNRPLPVLAEKKVTNEPADGDLLLAQDGKAMVSIVYAAGHTKSQSAAADLFNYLKRITGADFNVFADDQTIPGGSRILVGPTKQTFALGVEKLDGYPESERYIIRRIGDDLILYGNDDGNYTCTQYAVTRFLEEAGCGWFAEDALWEIVPEDATLAVKDWDQTFAPLFATRQISWDNKAILRRWYLGGDQHTFGHTLWYGSGGLVHLNEYEQHPEWFAMIDGEHKPPTGWWQYCYTNEEFIATVAQRIVDRFNKSPNLTTFSVSANDGWDEGWCNCETCLSKGSRSDQMLFFANSVAEIVCQTHPDKTINFLAYHATFLPPETDIKAHPNVEVMFCMETNPFTDPTLDYVVHQGYNGMTKVEYSQSWQDNVNQWMEQTDLKGSSIWCWLCISTGSSVWMGAPWIQGNTVTRTFALYQEMGVSRIFADPGSERLDIRWPLIYVYARSMWDDVPDAEAVIYDSCKKLYGEAADEMFLYYRLLSDCTAINVDDTGLTWVPPSIFSAYGMQIKEIRAAVAAVQAKMDQLTPEQQERVKLHLNTWAYADAVM